MNSSTAPPSQCGAEPSVGARESRSIEFQNSEIPRILRSEGYWCGHRSCGLQWETRSPAGGRPPTAGVFSFYPMRNMAAAVNPKRVRSLTRNSTPSKSGKCVVYWMSRDQRADDNWALLHARSLAEELHVPVRVVFNMVPKFLEGGRRHYVFMLEGLAETDRKLRSKQYPLHVLHSHNPADALVPWLKKIGAAAVVSDMCPLRIRRDWAASVAAELDGRLKDVPLLQVDAHNVVPVWVASNKVEIGARTLRSKIHAHLKEFFTDFPELPPNVGGSLPDGSPEPHPWASLIDAGMKGTPPPASTVQSAIKKEGEVQGSDPRLAEGGDWGAAGVPSGLLKVRSAKQYAGDDEAAAKGRAAVKKEVDCAAGTAEGGGKGVKGSAEREKKPKRATLKDEEKAVAGVVGSGPLVDVKDSPFADGIAVDVPPVKGVVGGAKAAGQHLKAFLESKLGRFDTERNDPNAGALSELSPYLNFGQFSAQRAAWEAKMYTTGKATPFMEEFGVRPSKGGKVAGGFETFFEEEVVRRELSDNFCFYCRAYDSEDGAAEWAKKTLKEHEGDPRAVIYTQRQMECCGTHDELWNAAQAQVVTRGRMHGYIRMYWAKKILEWSACAADAIRVAVLLNDRYAYDGMAPNGYVGCMWSVYGTHDRGWPEHQVVGKIRYMNYNGCARKFDVASYVEAYPVAAAQAITGSPPEAPPKIPASYSLPGGGPVPASRRGAGKTVVSGLKLPKDTPDAVARVLKAAGASKGVKVKRAKTEASESEGEATSSEEGEATVRRRKTVPAGKRGRKADSSDDSSESAISSSSTSESSSDASSDVAPKAKRRR